ncbi:glutathione S-transferase family protein [Vibrio fluvialis]|uniref:glutathione S-transferase family protein n=1 Tax=Vibrio fluvialis TaxID=676 RepID=UPI00192B4F71|nr:glutathione S-transferase [Vibrio fluvialis]MBL4239024.1 glutathione S-transferase [Vibrio fluvialis]MBL4266556.1 glutathione S-transferase [Vibrio fluvialis]MBL4268813.1 glutathione S-transferase [Vibrio fluvialis]MBL4275535.1 glutathione S-transferase [Vibrio fluvialis]MBO1439300.1 glutathione S-transferase [Vibrio fluvialis]
MITLHHLNRSRSKRIIWLLEELEVEYQIVPYQRDSVTFLAPPELKAVHPLGKSPVIESDGRVIAESGAITEYLIERFAPQRLAPARDSTDYIDYLQWLHFAESSGILPLLLKLFLAKDGAKTQFLEGYANSEAAKVLGYVNAQLEDKNYLVADKLSGADIMMSFIAEGVQTSGMLDHFPNIKAYLSGLSALPAYQKANRIEAELSA